MTRVEDLGYHSLNFEHFDYYPVSLTGLCKLSILTARLVDGLVILYPR